MKLNNLKILMNWLKKELEDENDNERDSYDCDEEDNKEILLELVEQTIDQKIDGVFIYFKLLEEEDKLEEDAAKTELINKLQKKSDEEIFSKKSIRRTLWFL